MKKIVLLLIVFFWSYAIYSQETNKAYIFYMKDGKAIRGYLTDKVDNMLLIKTLDGESISIDKKDVEEFKEIDAKAEEKNAPNKKKSSKNKFSLSFAIQYSSISLGDENSYYYWYGGSSSLNNIYFDALGQVKPKDIGLDNKLFENFLLGLGAGISYFNDFDGSSVFKPYQINIPLYLNIAYNYKPINKFLIRPSLNFGYDFKLTSRWNDENKKAGFFFKPRIDFDYLLKNNSSIGLCLSYYINSMNYKTWVSNIYNGVYFYSYLKEEKIPNYLQIGIVYTFN
ncbi:MAG: hypothetical protein HXX18_00390 [Bacteroidetes bacterium]|nr:hypothetical protein [Bacteroidota bacterium]